MSNKTELSAEEIVFSKLVAKGYSYTQAYRKAFETSKDLAYATVRRKAFQLATKENIVSEVATTKERTAHLARLAEGRIEDILVNDSSVAKGNKVAEVAMFMYEQANGKATQKVVTEGKHLVISMDLSGGQGGEVPKEVLEQLAE